VSKRALLITGVAALALTLGATGASVIAQPLPVTAALAPAPASPSAKDNRPNFVIIQTDDQTVQDLSVMSRTKRLMRDKGTIFTQMMTPFAICCPSRAAMMSAA
jgi:hypothetical protein